MFDLEAQLFVHAETQCCRQLVLLLTMVIAHVIFYYRLLFLSKREKILYHTSILMGRGWILELLTGHPD